MPSSYTPSQKNAISQFVGFTQAKDSLAAKTLKSHGWNVEQAVDTYFQNMNNGSSQSNSSSSTSNLNKIFDKYRGPEDDQDQITIDGSMRYLQDLDVELEEPVVFALLVELGAPTIGELSRQEFVEGWSRLRADTISKQKQHIPTLRRALPANSDTFKKTYKGTFQLGRAAGSKVIPLDNAIEYWKTLFSAPSLDWSSETTPWLQWWIEYLESKWKKAVSKDMWDQTGLFVTKSIKDESMSWWSEEGSWPGVIDDFVAFVKVKREQGSQMDVG